MNDEEKKYHLYHSIILIIVFAARDHAHPVFLVKKKDLSCRP